MNFWMNYTLCFCVQDLQIDEEVDVIVSEWMGYMLLYEVTNELFHWQEFVGNYSWK